MKRRPSARAQAGMTLAELLVSLTLGLLVMLVGSALLMASNSAYTEQAEATRLNDSATYAMETITRALRQTAFVNWDSADAPVGTAAADSANIGGLDARSVARSGEGIEETLADAVNGSDVLALRYFGIGAGSGGDGSVLNCAGFGVGAASGEAGRGWSIFYVARDALGEAELRCKYRGASSWGADAIVRGVDSFQVLYGIDTDTPADGLANRFVNATAINAMDQALLLAGATPGQRLRDLNRQTHWKRVVSLKVALLLHGGRSSHTDSLAPRFDLFGRDYSDVHGTADPGVAIVEEQLAPVQRGRARRLITASILLRNRPTDGGA